MDYFNHKEQAAELEKIVCTCTGVTGKRIKNAVDSGASTLAEIQEATGASTVCGACLEEVESLLARFVSQDNGAYASDCQDLQ